VRLNDLVDDMLDLTKPRKPELSPTDLAAIAREVVALASRLGRSAQDVAVAYLGPAEGSRLEVIADSRQLRQVVWNLVRNGVQASGPGAQVTVHVRADHRQSVIEVSDTGPGISSEAREHLFDAFFTTRSHGVGIGLAVVKRIVEDHGWSIEVRSDAGQMTVFQVTIPNRRQATR
jgi:two-component system, NtrC family, sensor histidine kinase HydH